MLGAFLMVASLFFLWGFAHSILDVLNKHFQDVLVVSKARSALVQAMVYGGYFLMALPAGMINRRWGYKRGLVTGLALYSLGAMMFIPGALWLEGSFAFFLLCLFVIGCGLTCLETSANPYITVLGEPGGAARRLNLAQSLNGLGWIIGPAIGGWVILGHGSIAIPYAVLGSITMAMAFVFSRIRLPEVGLAEAGKQTKEAMSLRNIPSYTWGIVALFFYVGAQTGINSFFINYVLESFPGLSPTVAANMLAFGGMGLFFLGRLLGTWLLGYIRPSRLMVGFSLLAILCMTLVVAELGLVSVGAICLTYLFESIMFPTIFTMALSEVDANKASTAGSYLIMSIVGGAITPILMGLIGESSMAVGFMVPLFCFVIIAVYCLWYAAKIER